MSVNKKIICIVAIIVVALAAVIAIKTVNFDEKTASPRGVLVKRIDNNYEC